MGPVKSWVAAFIPSCALQTDANSRVHGIRPARLRLKVRAERPFIEGHAGKSMMQLTLLGKGWNSVEHIDGGY